MLTVFLEVATLMAVIIVPLRGPGKIKRKAPRSFLVDKDVSHARYAVNEAGDLVELYGPELTGHRH